MNTEELPTLLGQSSDMFVLGWSAYPSPSKSDHIEPF